MAIVKRKSENGWLTGCVVDMTAFDTAWQLVKMPFVHSDKIPEIAWGGVLGSVSPYEHQLADDEESFWVDDEERPMAWGLHRDKDYRTGDGTHVGAEIPYFELHPAIRGKGKGREALMQYIRELKENPYSPMRRASKVLATEVIPSSRGFWDKMEDEGIIQGYWEE